MRRVSFAFFLLLVGCPSPGLHTGLTSVKSQQGFSLNTKQNCVRAAEAVRLADAVLPVILDELTTAGYVKDYWAATKYHHESTLRVCLVMQPEPCSAGGWTRGPLGPTLPGAKYPLAARKRGCATGYGAWAALTWPPLCRAEWPDEPHCTKDKSVLSTTGWRRAYIHELFNVAIQRWASYKRPEGNYYKHPIYKVKEAALARLAKELAE